VKPIQTLPKGLLDTFGLRTLGRYPDTLIDAIAPTYDVDLLQGMPNAEAWTGEASVDGSAGAASLVGFIAPQNVFRGDLEVPQNELWIVRKVRVYVNTVGGTATVQSTIAGHQLLNSSGLAFETWPLNAQIATLSYASSAQARTHLTYSLDQPFVLMPTSQPALMLVGTGWQTPGVNDAITGQWEFWFNRLRP